MANDDLTFYERGYKAGRRSLEDEAATRSVNADDSDDALPSYLTNQQAFEAEFNRRLARRAQLTKQRQPADPQAERRDAEDAMSHATAQRLGYHIRNPHPLARMMGEYTL